MLGNLAGWHFMIILGVLAVSALVVVVLIALGVRFGRRKTPDGR